MKKFKNNFETKQSYWNILKRIMRQNKDIEIFQKQKTKDVMTILIEKKYNWRNFRIISKQNKALEIFQNYF